MSETMAVPEKKEAVKVKLNFEIVRKYINPYADDQEIYTFLQLCRAQNLNPFMREVYLIKYAKDQPAAIVVGKETFLKRANRHPSYKGFRSGVIVSYSTKEGPAISYPQGAVVLQGQSLIGGWCDALRSDRDEPIRIEVMLTEYEGHKSDGSVTRMWAGKQATMIRKVAVVQAHREAFPDETGGMLAPEELPYIDITDLPTYSMDKPAPGHIEPPQKKEIKDPDAPASENQTKAIFAMLGKLDIKGDEVQHQYCGFILSKEIKSMKDLTKGEASALIEKLQEKIKEMAA